MANEESSWSLRWIWLRVWFARIKNEMENKNNSLSFSTSRVKVLVISTTTMEIRGHGQWTIKRRQKYPNERDRKNRVQMSLLWFFCFFLPKFVFISNFIWLFRVQPFFPAPSHSFYFGIIRLVFANRIECERWLNGIWWRKKSNIFAISFLANWYGTAFNLSADINRWHRKNYYVFPTT